MADYQIGATSSMTNVESLGTPLDAPKSEYMPYARTVNLGDGGKRGVGFPVATWTFGILTLEQRDMLKTFCAGASAQVWIRTKLNDDVYDDFTATMLWVENETRWYVHKQNYQVLFRNLVAV